MDFNLNDYPSPDQYNSNFGFDAAEKFKGQTSANFQSPVQKKIYPVNLYDPHSEATPKTRMPGPGYYNTFDKNTIKERTNVDSNYLNAMKLSAVFIEENVDRFGNQIYPTKTTAEVPGPAYYHIDKFPNKKSVQGVAITTAKRDVFDEKATGEAKVGPGSYNTNVEARKISFFLNQGDKWVS